MAQSRDVGSLGQASITPAQFKPDYAFAGPADQSATNALIQGLGNLSDGVSRLGMAFAQEQKVKKEDPETHRLAAARASLENIQDGNDPDKAAQRYASTDPTDTVNRRARGSAAADAYFDRVKANFLQLASEKGYNNVDWDKQFADAVTVGKKKGYLPDDNAGASFLANAQGLVDTFRTNGNLQGNQDNAYKRMEDLRVATATEFTKSLRESGPEKAQSVLDNLYASEKYTSLGPEQRQKLLETTISGLVNSGDVRSFRALAGVDGPDGRPLKDTYANEWQVWKTQVEDNAKKVYEKDLVQGSLDSSATYEEGLKKFKGASLSYAQAVAQRRNMALNLAKESLDKAEADAAAGKAPDIDKIRADAVERGKADGIFDPNADGGTDASAVFLQTFDSGSAQYKSQKQNAENLDARAKSDTETTNALQVAFDTALRDGGPAAAKEAISKVMVENHVFGNRQMVDQGKMLAGLAQTYAKQGNTKALAALADVQIPKLGQTVGDFLQSDMETLKAQADEVSYNNHKATIEPLKVKIRAASNIGALSDELIQEGMDAGIPIDFLTDQQKSNEATIAAKTSAVQKTRETTAKAQFLDKNATQAAKAIRSGRADLLLGSELALDPQDPTKVLKISREDQLAAGMKEAEDQFAAEYDAKNPGADPKKRMMDIHHEVMRMHSRSGIVDENTKQTFKSFMQKAQRDGYSLGPEDIGQLNDMRDAADIYSSVALDDLIGGDGKKRDFYDAMMAKLNETDDPGTAIAYARHIRDAADQRVEVPEKKLSDLLTSATSELGIEGDPYIEGALKTTLKRHMGLGASDDYAKSLAVKEIQSRYVPVNGRHVNVKQLAPNAPAEAVGEVLNDAVEQYKKAHADQLDGVEIAFDNGPRTGTLQIYDKTTGLPISSKLVNWSDIYQDYDKRVLKPRQAQEATDRSAREAALMEKTKQFALQQEEARKRMAERDKNLDGFGLQPHR